jgi:membrane protein YdbS with pleckstrin-like domain
MSQGVGTKSGTKQPSKGEPPARVLWEGRPRGMVLILGAVRALVVAVLVLLTLAYLALLVGRSSWSGGTRVLTYGVLCIPALIAALTLFAPFMALRMAGGARYQVTDREVVIDTGGDGRVIPLGEIWRVERKDDWLGRVFGVGTIRFHTGERGTTQASYAVFRAIPDVDAATAALRRALAGPRKVEWVEP